jgi:hypothetical protein
MQPIRADDDGTLAIDHATRRLGKHTVHKKTQHGAQEDTAWCTRRSKKECRSMDHATNITKGDSQTPHDNSQLCLCNPNRNHF